MITTIDNFDLTDRNTFAMRVKCKRFIEYDDAADLPEIISSIGEMPMFHIGEGSNLLFTGDFPGAILHSKIKSIDILSNCDGKVTIRVGSGVKMDDLIKDCCDKELWGLENLSGIPGEVGASAVQNVGAYGVEACDCIVAVHAFDIKESQYLTFTTSECQYGYRDSLFKRPTHKGRYIIHSVDFQLSHLPVPVLRYPTLNEKFKNVSAVRLKPGDLRKAVMETRDQKLPDPAVTPSAGSFFKNPIVSQSQFNSILRTENRDSIPHYPVEDMIKIPAAWLIDQCGWKGKTEGNVAVWHLQPLVIVNPERKATPQEVISLESQIIDSVKSRFDITLSPEVEHI